MTEDSSYVTKSGKVLTEEDILSLSQKAERGYDITKLGGGQWRSIESIARNFGPVAVAYVSENASDDPADDMPWTVSMFDAADGWQNHEHGRTMEGTAMALLIQLIKEKKTK